MRTKFEASIDKRRAVNQAEKEGNVADSLEVRKQLMEAVHSGSITLQEAQERLSKIQRSAKKNGKVTRAQAYSRG